MGGVENPPLNSSASPNAHKSTPTNTIIELSVRQEVGLDAVSSPITEKDMGLNTNLTKK